MLNSDTRYQAKNAGKSPKVLKDDEGAQAIYLTGKTKFRVVPFGSRRPNFRTDV